MQILHRFNPAFVFSRAYPSSSRLPNDQAFIVRVKLTGSSESNTRWPHDARWTIASLVTCG